MVFITVLELHHLGYRTDRIMMQVGVVNLTKALAGGQRKVEEEEREGAHVFHLIHQVHPQATVDYRVMIEQMAFGCNKEFAPKRHICVAEGLGLTNSQLKVSAGKNFTVS
jgi:hypothetical protein